MSYRVVTTARCFVVAPMGHWFVMRGRSVHFHKRPVRGTRTFVSSRKCAWWSTSSASPRVRGMANVRQHSNAFRMKADLGFVNREITCRIGLSVVRTMVLVLLQVISARLTKSVAFPARTTTHVPRGLLVLRKTFASSAVALLAEAQGLPVWAGLCIFAWTVERVEANDRFNLGLAGLFPSKF